MQNDVADGSKHANFQQDVLPHLFVVPLSQSLEPVIVTRQGNQFQLASETVITGNKISWNRWKNQLVLIFGYGSPK